MTIYIFRPVECQTKQIYLHLFLTLRAARGYIVIILVGLVVQPVHAVVHGLFEDFVNRAYRLKVAVLVLLIQAVTTVVAAVVGA